MSSKNATVKSDVTSVEEVVDFLVAESGLPIKSLTIIHNVIAGVILGEVDEVDHEMDLAAGVTYLVVGLGKLPTQHERGIDLIDFRRKT